jgi:GNAT superfamily N-acetyltransferase
MIDVRPARVEDAEAVVRVHEEASAVAFEELVGRRFADVFPREERLEHCVRRLAAAHETDGTLVAELDGVIVGMALWGVDESGAGELEDLHVVPKAWGTAVARSLLEGAVTALVAAGATQPFLWVGEANDRARRFYEREGWSHDGTREPSPLGPMQLRYRLTREPMSTDT